LGILTFVSQSFNPCFVGCVSGINCFILSNCDNCKVSILVLLDVCRECHAFLLSILLLFRFNPCFVGCVSGICVLPNHYFDCREVSILVLLDVCRE